LDFTYLAASKQIGVSSDVVLASPVDAAAVAEPAGRVGFDSMVDLLVAFLCCHRTDDAIEFGFGLLVGKTLWSEGPFGTWT
jgi:hypothetical protein